MDRQTPQQLEEEDQRWRYWQVLEGVSYAKPQHLMLLRESTLALGTLLARLAWGREGM